ncbi:MAG: hypothetical protein K1X81_11275 [Bacteroidia bacterium]|nr:hypothetical protein [Bacteroidia bacterium]
MKRMIVFVGMMFFYTAFSQTDLPLLNKKVIVYVKSVTGKQVGHGECWDLAKEALNYAGAKWDGAYGFGKKLTYGKDKLLPGDIVQFTGVTMEHKEGNSLSRWKMPKHTAVVYEVKSETDITLAEQNFNNIRRVMLNSYNLNDVKQGTLSFYRPE